jgi:hypothetical protein
LRIAPDELTGAAVVLALFPAALFVTWATTGRSGVRALFNRAFRWRVSPWWWLTVLLGLPILTVGLARLMGDDLRPVDITSVVVSQLTFLLVNFVVINLWEETAWTGLFQTRLEESAHQCNCGRHSVRAEPPVWGRARRTVAGHRVMTKNSLYRSCPASDGVLSRAG